MPGNPFKKPFTGGKTRATPRRPSRPNSNRKAVPTPEVPNGIKSRRVANPTLPAVKVTTKARKGVKLPRVKQGTPLGTPGRTGSRPGAPWE